MTVEFVWFWCLLLFNFFFMLWNDSIWSACHFRDFLLPEHFGRRAKDDLKKNAFPLTLIATCACTAMLILCSLKSECDDCHLDCCSRASNWKERKWKWRKFNTTHEFTTLKSYFHDLKIDLQRTQADKNTLNEF